MFQWEIPRCLTHWRSTCSQIRWPLNPGVTMGLVLDEIIEFLMIKQIPVIQFPPSVLFPWCILVNTLKEQSLRTVWNEQWTSWRECDWWSLFLVKEHKEKMASTFFGIFFVKFIPNRVSRYYQKIKQLFLTIRNYVSLWDSVVTLVT